LIQQEKWKRAQEVFQEEMELISRLPYLGALHLALLFKTGAQLAWKINDQETWNQRIVDALKLMQEAGLDHQMRQIRQLYGPALIPALEELGNQKRRSIS
jgi:hypothetical protein